MNVSIKDKDIIPSIINFLNIEFEENKTMNIFFGSMVDKIKHEYSKYPWIGNDLIEDHAIFLGFMEYNEAKKKPTRPRKLKHFIKSEFMMSFMLFAVKFWRIFECTDCSETKRTLLNQIKQIFNKPQLSSILHLKAELNVWVHFTRMGFSVQKRDLDARPGQPTNGGKTPDFV